MQIKSKLDETEDTTEEYKTAVATYIRDVEPQLVMAAPVDAEASTTSDGKALKALEHLMWLHNVPAGMLSKLLEMQTFQAIEILVDDSCTNPNLTDERPYPVGPQGTTMKSSWEEARMVIEELLQYWSYLKVPPIQVRFFNRMNDLHLAKQEGETPTQFVERCH